MPDIDLYSLDVHIVQLNIFHIKCDRCQDKYARILRASLIFLMVRMKNRLSIIEWAVLFIKMHETLLGLLPPHGYFK